LGNSGLSDKYGSMVSKRIECAELVNMYARLSGWSCL